MSMMLAHTGHDHGTDPSLIALIAVVVVLGALALIATIRARSRS